MDKKTILLLVEGRKKIKDIVASIDLSCRIVSVCVGDESGTVADYLWGNCTLEELLEYLEK